MTSRQSARGRRMRSSAMFLGEHHNDFTPTMPEHDHRTLFIDDGAGIFHRTDMPYLPDLHVPGTYRSWATGGSPELQMSTRSLSEFGCRQIPRRCCASLPASCSSTEFERLHDRPVDHTAVFVDISEPAGEEESILHCALLSRLSGPHVCKPGCRQLISNTLDLIPKSHGWHSVFINEPLGAGLQYYSGQRCRCYSTDSLRICSGASW